MRAVPQGARSPARHPPPGVPPRLCEMCVAGLAAREGAGPKADAAAHPRPEAQAAGR